jgi:adenosine deaminase
VETDNLEIQIAALPKAELHCHLDGLLDASMLVDIWRDEPDFPVQPEHLSLAQPVHDLESFFRWWDFVRPLKGQLLRYAPVIKRYLSRLKAQQARYFELFVPSGDVPQDTGKAVDTVREFSEIIERNCASDLEVNLVFAFGRNKTLEQVEEVGERALALHKAGLVTGVAMAGPEIGWPVRPFRSVFARLHEAGIKIEIHAGEWCGPESIWDALEYGCPDRIGHSVTLFQDPRLVEIFQERQIHIEMCPTSNWKTGSVPNLAAHPLGKAKDLGLNFSINTDDPGPFGNSLEGEYRLAVDLFGFTIEDLQKVYTNTMNSRFIK